MREIDKPSVVQKDRERCFVCGRSCNLENHHVLEGMQGYKPLAEKYGLLVTLCRDCHTGKNGVHNNHKLNEVLMSVAQRKAMETYEELNTIEKWRHIFKKNFLIEEDLEEFLND